MNDLYSGIENRDVIDSVSYNKERSITTLSVLQEQYPANLSENQRLALLESKIMFYLSAWESGRIHELYSECKGTKLEILIAHGFDEIDWIEKVVEKAKKGTGGAVEFSLVRMPLE